MCLPEVQLCLVLASYFSNFFALPSLVVNVRQPVGLFSTERLINYDQCDLMSRAVDIFVLDMTLRFSTQRFPLEKNSYSGCQGQRWFRHSKTNYVVI